MATDTATAEVDHTRTIASIGGHLTKLSTHHHSLLRRMSLTESISADGVVVKLLMHAGLEPHQYHGDFPRWRFISHLASLLSGTSKADPHDPKRSVGAALQEAGLSENRLLRLTAARDQALRDQIALAVRRVAKAGKGPINLRTLFDLAGADEDRAEKARLRLARDYYAAEARSEGDEK